MAIWRQDLKMDMANSIKVAIADTVALMANKPPPTIIISPEALDKSVKQALETQKEISRISNKLSS